jgi:hypothetical protein
VHEVYWFFILGRLWQELGQLRIHGLRQYLESFWNKVDVLLLTLQVTAFALQAQLSLLDNEGRSAVAAGDKARGAITPNLRQLTFDVQVRSRAEALYPVHTRSRVYSWYPRLPGLGLARLLFSRDGDHQQPSRNGRSACIHSIHLLRPPL